MRDLSGSLSGFSSLVSKPLANRGAVLVEESQVLAAGLPRGDTSVTVAATGVCVPLLVIARTFDSLTNLLLGGGVLPL